MPQHYFALRKKRKDVSRAKGSGKRKLLFIKKEDAKSFQIRASFPRGHHSLALNATLTSLPRSSVVYIFRIFSWTLNVNSVYDIKIHDFSEFLLRSFLFLGAFFAGFLRMLTRVSCTTDPQSLEYPLSLWHTIFGYWSRYFFPANHGSKGCQGQNLILSMPSHSVLLFRTWNNQKKKEPSGYITRACQRSETLFGGGWGRARGWRDRFYELNGSLYIC